MNCGQCGAANRDDARFCAQCGAPLSASCAACGRDLAPDARFCDGCGTPVAAEVAAPPPATEEAPAPGAVRKTVTALFCDLGGSTAFGERVDPEMAREAMTEYRDLIAGSVSDQGGTVAKFTGDGLLAFFGIPEVAEDDAVRAVAAGVAMQERFGAFARHVDERFGERLTLRVGINTGEVVVGDDDADVVGDALNVAARLEQTAGAGRVLVGEETWRLTRGHYRYDPLGEVVVAGRTEPVRTYQVAAAERETDIATPFVGRDDEMGRLRAVFDEAVASGATRLVTVLASPGVGKTRLARELVADLANRANGFELRCDRVGEATFAPVAEILRVATGLGDEADPDVIRTRLGELVGGEPDERERVVDGLAGIMGVSASKTTEETFWAVRRLVEALAADQPLVIVLDDVQWAEPLLLDLLEHLREWVRTVPVLLVGLARPEIRELRPALVEPGLAADVLVLDGLDAAATEALAARLLGAERLPTEIVERLPGSTAGNPLFVRELVRMLVDDEVLVRRGDEWVLTIDAEAVEVPPTIQSLLAARVDRLSPPDRVLLELAAVAGAEFTRGALAMLADGDDVDVDLDRGLERLRRNELVEPIGTYWGNEPLYRFHHTLIQDAAYRRILKSRRAELHEQVGRWADEVAAGMPGEPEAAIAHHFEQAFAYRRELGTLDERARALGTRAAALLATAAQRALDRDDLAASGSLAARALDCLDADESGERAELLLLACEALLSIGDVGAARRHVEELRSVAGADDRLAAWSQCFDAQLVSLTDPNALVDAERSVTAAADTLAQLDDGAGQAKAHFVRAGILARLGQVAQCEAELDRALSAARTVDDRRRVIAVLGAAPVAALWGPSPVARAGGRCLDVVRLLRITSASPSVEATSMRCQAVLEGLRGRLDTARSMLGRARAMVEELGLRRDLLETEVLAGYVELVADDPGAAEKHLRAAYGGLGAMGVGVDAGQAAALLSQALLAQGRVDEADELAAISEERAGQNLKTAIAWRAARAEVLSAREAHGQAVALAEDAVELASATDIVLDHAAALRTLGRVRAAAGDARGAAEAGTAAVSLYETKGATALVERLTGSTSGAVAQLESVLSEHPVIRRQQQFFAEVDTTDEASVRRWYAPDYRHIDHRAVIGGEVSGDSDEMVDWVANFMGEAVHGMTLVEEIETRGDRLALFRQAFSDDIEWEALIVQEHDEQGRQLFTGFWDPDDLEGARGELEERWAAQQRGRTGPMPVLENTATRLLSSGLAAMNSGDFDPARPLTHEDFVRIDRRKAVSAPPTEGRDDFRSAVRAAYDAGDVEITAEAMAVRGDHLALCRLQDTDYDTGWEITYLGVCECDGAVMTRAVHFDEDDFAEAMEELDHRYAELGGGNRATETVRRMLAVVADGDFDALANMVAEDFRGADHRRSVGGARLEGSEDLVRVWQIIDELGSANNGVLYVAAVVEERGNDLALAWMRAADAMTGEAAVESLFAVQVDEDGLFVRGNQYDLDRLDEALADLEEREREQTVPAHALENRATRVPVELSAELDGVEVSTLAVRGERICLREYRGTSRGVEQRGLSVSEVDESGRSAREVHFDPDDLADAADLLDRWYLEAEQGPHTAWLRIGADVQAAVNAQDWSRYADLFADDVVIVDHRVLAHVDGIRPGAVRERADQVTSLTTYTREFHRLDEALAVLTPVMQGTSPDGGPIAWTQHVVMEIRGGRVVRIETFDEEDLDAAIARYDELTGERSHRLENQATLLREAGFAAVRARDREGAGRLFAPEFQREDRTSGPGSGATDGASRYDSVAALAEVFDDLIERQVAVYGDRISLSEVRFVSSEGFEWQVLALVEVDADGRQFIREVDFDVEDLADATDLAARWYGEGEGAPYAGVLEAGRRAAWAFNHRDWEALEAVLAPDVVFRDNRPLTLESSGHRQWVVDMCRARVELVPDTVMLARETVRISADYQLGTIVQVGTDADGGQVEWVSHQVTDGRDGRISLMERFDEDDLEAALARFDELTRSAGPKLENRATRVRDLGMELLREGDRDRALQLYAPDYERVSHMEGPRSGATDAGGSFDAMRAALDVFEQVEMRTLAVQGEAMCLSEFRLTASGGYERSGLALLQIDDEGRIRREVMFDPGDLAEAADLAGHWYIEGEGSPYAEVIATGRRAAHAINARDWEAFEATLAPDLVFRENRSLTLEPTEYRQWALDMTRTRVELVPDLVLFARCTVRVSEDYELVTLVQRGTDAAGGVVEWVSHQVTDGRHGRISLMERFDEDDLDAAIARFDELNGSAQVLDNSAVRVAGAMVDAARAGDRATALALCAPDFVRESRASGPTSGRSDGAGTVDSYVATVGTFGEVELVPLSVLGDRIAISEIRARSEEGYEKRVLGVSEVDLEGRVRRTTDLDEDSVVEAADLALAWYAEGEGSDHGDQVERIREFWSAFNGRDWDRLGAVLGAGVTWRSHRALSLDSLGTAPSSWLSEAEGRDGVVERLAGFAEALPGVVAWPTRIHRLADRGVVLSLRQRAVDEDQVVEFATVVVAAGGSESVERIESYDEVDLDAALARFDELTGEEESA